MDVWKVGTKHFSRETSTGLGGRLFSAYIVTIWSPLTYITSCARMTDTANVLWSLWKSDMLTWIKKTPSKKKKNGYKSAISILGCPCLNMDVIVTWYKKAHWTLEYEFPICRALLRIGMGSRDKMTKPTALSWCILKNIYIYIHIHIHIKYIYI